MKKISLGIIGSLFALAASAVPAFAQTFSFPQDKVPFTNLGKLLANALIIIFFFAAVLAFVFILIGGIQWITAGGDKVAAGNARDRITAAIIGLVIVVATFGITLIITSVMGINIFSGTVIDFSKIAPPERSIFQ